MRLIDADALITNFGKLTVELWLDSVEEAEIVSLIGNAPTIEPKRGEWIKDKSKNIWNMVVDCYKCSNCGKKAIDHSLILDTAGLNFCPNCGADMRGEDNGQTNG